MGFNRNELKNEAFGVTQSDLDFLSHWRIDDVLKRLVSDRAVGVTLDSLYFGDMHKKSSSAVVLATTRLSDNSSSISCLTTIKDHSILDNRDSSGVTEPLALTLGDYVEVEMNGAVSTGYVGYKATEVLTFDFTLLGVEVFVKDEVLPTDILLYRIFFGSDATGREMYRQEITGRSIAADGKLDWWFLHPLIGSIAELPVAHVVMEKNGELLEIKLGTIDPTVRYIKTRVRPIAFKPIALSDELHDADKIISLNGLKSLTITDTTLKYNDGSPRFEFDSVNGKIFSPGSSTQYMKANATSVGFVMEGSNALHITSAAAKLTSKDGKNYIQLKNASAKIQAGGKERLWMDNLSSDIRSPNALNQLSVTNSIIKLELASKKRVWADGTSSTMMSPDQSQQLNVLDTGMQFVDVRSGADPTIVNRLQIDFVNSLLVSPNGLENLKVDNNGAFYTGSEIMTVATGVQNSGAGLTNSVPRYTDATGKKIDDTLVTISDTNVLGFDNSTIVNTDNILVAQNEDIVIDVITADKVLIIETNVTTFTVRDLSDNIDPFNVRIVFVDGTDELTLTRGGDFVRISKHNNVWYFYNFRNGLGSRVTA